MARTLRIGLTGGIASGKSTVSKLFADLGVPVIDADEVARQVVLPGTPGLAAIQRRFGAGVLNPDGNLNRRALRNVVFDDPGARRELEALLHPLIRAEMERQSAAAGGRYQIFAIPLLVEGGPSDRVDRVLVVDADEGAQLARVMARDGIGETQARAIMAAQADRAARLSAADEVITNEGSVADLRQAVAKLHDRFLQIAASRA
jgi:dephospho-CoA kinase